MKRKLTVLPVLFAMFVFGACGEQKYPKTINDVITVGNNNDNGDGFHGISIRLKMSGEINQTCDAANIAVISEPSNVTTTTDTASLGIEKRIPLNNGSYHVDVAMDCAPNDGTSPVNHYVGTSNPFVIADNEVAVHLSLHLMPHGGALLLTISIDSDGDGYTDDLDCNDLDPAVNSGTAEIVGNGIDDNCNGVVDEAATDTDGDTVPDTLDNCPFIPNFIQNALCGTDVVYILCTSAKLDLTAASLWSATDNWTAAIVRNGEWSTITPIVGAFQFNVQVATGEWLYTKSDDKPCQLWHEGIPLTVSSVPNGGTGYNGEVILPSPLP